MDNSRKSPMLLALAFAGIASADGAKDFGIVNIDIPFDINLRSFVPEMSVFYFEDSRNVKTFLRSIGAPIDRPTAISQSIRVSLRNTKLYLERYNAVKDFLRRYDERRFVRLGPEALCPPWKLSKDQASILMLDESEFLRFYVPDPCPEALTAAAVASNDPERLLLPPLLRRPGFHPSPPVESLTEWGISLLERQV